MLNICLNCIDCTTQFGPKTAGAFEEILVSEIER